MFREETKKSRYEKLSGQVPADFYDEQYYVGEGKSNWDNAYDLKNFGKLFRKWAVFLIIGFPESKSFLDVGCARGFLEKSFIDLAKHNKRDDLEIGGFDLSPWAIANAAEDAKPFISMASVDNYVFKRKYDVLISLDTFEHLSEEQSTDFLKRSRKFINDYCFLVIALDEERQRAEPSHVNLQNREWWESKISECGWVHNWQTQMMEALARRERFMKSNKVEVFIRCAREEENSENIPGADRLLEWASMERWKKPENLDEA